jgi:16S rRNA (cytosine967-C5)-methyltransferase
VRGRVLTAPDARTIALDLFGIVMHRRVALDEALAAHDGMAALDPRDRAFARLVVATTLRRLGQIDALLAARLEHPLPPRASKVHDALRLAVAQLVFLGTPPHAAVDRAVASLGGRLAPFRGLANAVLRRIAREGAAEAARQDAPRLNTPEWLWESWRAAYGDETCRRIAMAHLDEAPLDISVKSDPERWAERLDARVLPTGTLRRAAGGAIAALPGYDAGEWWVQDAAAALPAKLLLAALDGGAGAHVTDLCAAPGGKAAQLCAAGARVTALDVSEARLAQLRDNLARLGLAAECRAGDARRFVPETPCDGVLLDAPCSGTGTIRRHPDIARLKSPDEVARLLPLQSALLDAAIRVLRPGGVLVYAVCSLQPEEGPAQIAAALERTLGLERLPLRAAELGDNPDALAPLVTPDGDLQTLPCHLADLGGLDGFYAARLTRR